MFIFIQEHYKIILNQQNKKAKKKPGNVLLSPYGYNRRYGA